MLYIYNVEHIRVKVYIKKISSGIGTNIDTEQGDSAELVSGLSYSVWKTPRDRDPFVVPDSGIAHLRSEQLQEKL
jgi:hypothetical protein